MFLWNNWQPSEASASLHSSADGRRGSVLEPDTAANVMWFCSFSLRGENCCEKQAWHLESLTFNSDFCRWAYYLICLRLIFIASQMGVIIRFRQIGNIWASETNGPGFKSCPQLTDLAFWSRSLELPESSFIHEGISWYCLGRSCKSNC